MTPSEHRELVERARRIREDILTIVGRHGSGHLGGAFSEVELLVWLYGRFLRVDPLRPDWPERDRFVLSKGHGGLGLAPVLADRGFFPREQLATFGETGAALGMHMDHRRVPGIETATGSLGHGLGVALGMALGLRLDGLPGRVVCLLSDGELHEGSTWEAAMAAPKLGGRLIAVVDRNRLTMDGPTEVELPLEPLADKWRAFDWCVATCDGHDFESIEAAFSVASSDTPAVVIAETVKGKGVGFMEGRPEWHYGALDSDAMARALAAVRA